MKLVMVMYKGRSVEVFSKFLGVFVILGLPFFFLLLTDRSANALTYSSDVDVNFTFNPTLSIQMSSPSDLVIPSLAPGSYADSNHVTITVDTNAAYGFQLSATVGTKNGTDALVNTSNNNYAFSNLSSGESSLASFSDDTWGYSYCYYSPVEDCDTHSEYWVYGNRFTNYSGYGALPLDDNSTSSERGNGGVILMNTIDGPDSGNAIKFKIGAKASTTQASGNYSNTINFYAVASPEPELTPMACEAGKICYHANSLDPVEGTMAMQSAVANDQVTLHASNYSRTGYGFAGWNTEPDYTGTFYGPNETITVPSDISSSQGFSLYAVWLTSAGDLQSWSGCSSLSTGDVTALKDARDNQVYAVAKLDDGNCWMIENLRLDSRSTSGSYVNMAEGYSTGFTGLANSEATANFNEVTTANSLYSTDGSTVNTITGNYIAERMPRYHNVNTAARIDYSTGIDLATYSYGNYYSWAAANADVEETYGNNDSVQNMSICPTGWSLPSGGNNSNTANSDFWNLGVAIVGSAPANASTIPNSYYTGEPEGQNATEAFRSYPNNFLFSGIVSDGQPNYRGSGGYYWTSTYSGPQTAYYVDYNGHNVYPGSSSYYKHLGMAVRCIMHDD
ncbi:InlB B-repeat-containing protein [Candidatus Saccharibacteria bacterium]|nr:InlB B-repeat-containing protein [Candidatus Saccharibacteria bacterium]